MSRIKVVEEGGEKSYFDSWEELASYVGERTGAQARPSVLPSKDVAQPSDVSDMDTPSNKNEES